jgi:hypothetical protein
MASQCSSPHSRLVARSTRVADFVVAVTFSSDFVTTQAVVSAAAGFFKIPCACAPGKTPIPRLTLLREPGKFRSMFGNIGQVVALVVLVPGEAVRACRT